MTLRKNTPSCRRQFRAIRHGEVYLLLRRIFVLNFRFPWMLYTFELLPSAPDNFDNHQYGYWFKWNLIRISYFQSVHVFILAFNFDWFKWNYKDQTNSKLLESGFCAHIILKTRVLQGDMLRGCNQTLWSLYWGKNKTSVSGPESWFWISECINFDRFTNQFNYQGSSDWNCMRNTVWLKTYRTGKNTPVFRTY